MENNFQSKDIIFSKKYLYNYPPLHKHLGLDLSSSLDFSVQIHEVCLKANRKLSVLRNVKLLSRQTLDLLYKIIVRSVIDYVLPAYFKTVQIHEVCLTANRNCQC